jgi:hypothetical protein
MFFEINKTLCESFNGLDPIRLLDYPAEDVFDLINHQIAYNQRQQRKQKKQPTEKGGVIRRPADDSWF